LRTGDPKAETPVVTSDFPETRYALTADGVHIAYQVFGEGAHDFVLMNSAYMSNVEVAWEWDESAHMYRWLAARGRVALIDRRGTGLSDGVSADTPPTLEARMDDIRAVMDAAGFERAVLYGLEDGAAQCFLFAATYPERTTAIVTFGASSRGAWAPDAPWQWTHEQWREEIDEVVAGWGTPAFTERMVQQVFPVRAGDASFVRTYGRAMRHAMSPGAAATSEIMWRDTDVRHVLPLIQAPTLVAHVTDDPVEPIEEGRYIAAHIPGAILLELPGAEHAWQLLTHGAERVDRFLADLTDVEAEFDRVLATVVFTDIVGTTDRAAAMGDRAWRDLLERHHATVRALIGRFRGAEVGTAGDGFFATFDGPARAVRCASAICEAVRALGIEVRAGVHTGEVETVDGHVGGLAVHIGARVGAMADASEVLVSQTVKDLVAGSGLAFDDAGEHELKGVPDRWRLYRVMA
jgi:class 3 adenylate cyclase/pimeloyl-ACP methyl ester carboxylesterase